MPLSSLYPWKIELILHSQLLDPNRKGFMHYTVQEKEVRGEVGAERDKRKENKEKEKISGSAK